jgi:hypothetical protein
MHTILNSQRLNGYTHACTIVLFVRSLQSHTDKCLNVMHALKNAFIIIEILI